MSASAWAALGCFGALAVALWIIQELMFRVAERKKNDDRPKRY